MKNEKIMYFNLKQTDIYQTVIWSSFFNYNKQLKKISLILFLVSLIIFLVLLFRQPTQVFLPLFQGLAIIFFSFFIISYLIDQFFENKLKKPELQFSLKQALYQIDAINMAEFLNYESAYLLNQVLIYQKWKNISHIQANVLLYFLVSLPPSPELSFILSRLLIAPKVIRDKIKLDSDFRLNHRKHHGEDEHEDKRENKTSIEEIILYAAQLADENEQKRIKIGNILVALSENSLILKDILITQEAKKDDIKNLNWWFNFIEEEKEQIKEFWSRDNLAKRGSLAKHLTYGFTVTLDRFSTDWTTNIVAQQVSQRAFFLEAELDTCEVILTRETGNNNVLLVGESGGGKSSVIYKLAERIFLNKSLPVLNQKRVVFLDVSSVLAQAESKYKVELILDTICQEVIKAGNIILVIDNFHDYVSTDDRPGVINILGILSPYLNYSHFQLIAITDHQGFAKFIEPHPSLLSLMEKVEVKELSSSQSYRILEGMIFYFEQKYRKFIPYPTIRTIIESSDRYILDKSFPKKATDLLSQVVSYVLKQGTEEIVLPKHVYHVVSERIGFHIGELEEGEKEKLINLERLMHQRIVGQEYAVKEISNALRRARTDVIIRKRPMGAFLFLGPTGVGKTETAKTLADIYFGQEEKMVRFDMSEFQNSGDITRLIGTKEEPGYLTTKIRANPFSVVLLDEIEKAHSGILDMFLVILDEGYIVDGTNRKVSFINTILIATSNVGSNIILRAFDQQETKGLPIELEKLRKDILDYSFSTAIFKPEFINRFDGVILFHPLSQANLIDITGLLLMSLKKKLREKEIELIITEPVKKKIITIGYNITYGAREIHRVIQNKIESNIAMALLKGSIEKGSKIEINPEDFSIIRH